MSEIKALWEPHADQDRVDHLSGKLYDISQHYAITSLLPSIADVTAAVNGLNDEIDRRVEASDPGTLNRLRQYRVGGFDIARATAALFLARPDETDSAAFCSEVLSSYMNKGLVKKWGIDKELSESVDMMADIVNLAREASSVTTPALISAMDADAAFALSFLKVMTAPLETLATPQEAEVSDIAAISTAEHFNGWRQNGSLIDDLTARLDSGQMDRWIALELFKDFYDNPSEPHNASRLQDIERLTGLLRAAGISETEAAAVVVSPRGIEHWPTRLSSALANAKAVYKNNLLERAYQRREMLAQQGLVLPEDPEAALKEAAPEFVRRLALALGRIDIVNQANVRLTRVDLIASRAKIRRQSRGHNGTGQPPKSAAAESSPILRESPRELYFIDAGGEKYQPASGELPDCVKDYVRKHGGNNQDLIPRIFSLFETLQLIDLSGQIVRGLIPHNRNVTINGVNIGTLWQIRPDKVVRDKSAIGHLGRHAAKLRIFGTLDHDVLAILKLLDKDEVIPFKRSLGIAGSSKNYK